MMRRADEEWMSCSMCGGSIPPRSQWGKRGERADGYCPGHQRADGMCGAFAPRISYPQAAAECASDAAITERARAAYRASLSATNDHGCADQRPIA